MLPRDLDYELYELFDKYKKKFGHVYPCSFTRFTNEEAKADLKKRIAEGGEPIPDELWKPSWDFNVGSKLRAQGLWEETIKKKRERKGKQLAKR